MLRAEDSSGEELTAEVEQLVLCPASFPADSLSLFRLGLTTPTCLAACGGTTWTGPAIPLLICQGLPGTLGGDDGTVPLLNRLEYFFFHYLDAYYLVLVLNYRSLSLLFYSVHHIYKYVPCHTRCTCLFICLYNVIDPHYLSN